MKTTIEVKDRKEADLIKAATSHIVKRVAGPGFTI